MARFFIALARNLHDEGEAPAKHLNRLQKLFGHFKETVPDRVINHVNVFFSKYKYNQSGTGCGTTFKAK